MATQPLNLSNGQMLLVPSNGPSVIQGGQAFPGTVMQPAGTVQYVSYGGQEFRSAANQPHQQPHMGPMEKLLKADIKTLGAVQIMIGLIHIGFGSLSFIFVGAEYISLATIGGYPLWAGLSFIISGSFSVDAMRHLSISQVKCSVGLNITSAIITLFGISLYMVEFVLWQIWMHYAVTGLHVLLFLFTLLEFCITVSAAHFGCQATCCNNERTVHHVPYTVLDVGTNFPESSRPPPYNPHESSAVKLTA
ncbi:membrane-spanning 4-domains subfamily A member 15 [Pogona vitticeps]